ncbi:MAG TPA: YbhN family protein [Acidimicrobiia bacterium]|jgi:hypothetical protein
MSTVRSTPDAMTDSAEKASRPSTGPIEAPDISVETDAVVALPTAEPPAHEHHTARRNIKRSVKVILFLIAFNYFGIPAIAGLRNAAHKLLQVSLPWLALGVLFEVLALLAYSQLMRVAIPEGRVSLFRLFRINLATKSVNNTVPGGSAAGAALGYRLLTTSGVAGADAGFALAATGLVSAVVLNLILWIALLVSLPFNGVNPGYGIVAILGVVVLLFAAGLMLSLMRGGDRAKRFLNRLTRHIRFIDSDRANEVVEQVAGRLSEIVKDRELVERAAIWATLNWLLDAASLFVFVRAFGEWPNVIGLLVAFGLANVLAVIPITPGGLGIVETVMVGTLVGFGTTPAVAALAVPTYRLAQFWLPIPLGGAAYLSVRRDQRPGKLRDAGRSAYAQPSSRFEWAEEYGHRPNAGDAEAYPPHIAERDI